MTAASEPIVRMPLRVRYHECDMQGVVFNAHYLAYADMASFELLKALFGSYGHLTERGVDLVVAESNARYLGSCRYDDELVVEARVDRVGTTSLVLCFDIYRENALVTQVTNRYVWISTRTMKPVAPPEDVRDAFTSSKS